MSKLAVVALPIAIALLWHRAFAQDPPQTARGDQKFFYGAETDFNSAYVWHGIVITDGPVMQPSAWISAYGFTVITWSNLALAKAPDGARLQDTGVIVTYARDWKKLRIEPALEAYLNRQPEDIDGGNTMEGSVKLSFPAGPFRIFTIHAFDMLAYKGAYFGEVGLSYARHFTKRTELAAGVRSGWTSSKFNDVYIGLDKAALNFMGAEGMLTYHVRPHVYLQPHFEFSRSADRQLREYLPSPTFVNLGLAIGIEF
jgi:hypothetical protein